MFIPEFDDLDPILWRAITQSELSAEQLWNSITSRIPGLLKCVHAGDVIRNLSGVDDCDIKFVV